MYDIPEYHGDYTPHNPTPPDDYRDAEGSHVMCACGHYVTGPEPGSHIAMCPNCNFLARLGEKILVVYSDLLP